MRKTYKIGLACFIGGVIGTIVALLVAPMFWWLGVFAGFAAGYLAYEFRAVLAAIPEAWEMTAKKIFSPIFMELKEFFFEERPAFFLGLFYSSVFFTTLTFLPSFTSNPIIPEGIPVITFLFIFLSLLCGFALFIVTMLLVASESGDKININDIFSLPYGKIVRMSGRRIIFLLQGTLVLSSAIIIGVLKFAVKFPWTLFKLIHSNERLLCGVDAGLGTMIAYFLSLNLAPLTTATFIFLVICGGIFGAGFGIVNYEIISKRLFKFHLTPAS
ncbi:MAG: hypothetical protein PHD51_03400 [Patescibacteria group bacterium]|nr:hypothetical protein [Patescibacteria group bacterium]MDD5490977.1 hypothetical protein [Patescibacteria group bacterium]